MKFICETSSLRMAIEAVIPTIKTGNNAIPILGCILFKVVDDRLFLRSTNLESFTEVAIPMEEADKKNFSFSMEGNKIYEIFKKLKENRVRFELLDDTVKVSAKGFQTVLSVLPGKDFPEETNNKIKHKFTVKRDELIRAYSLSAFSVSIEDTRPLLKCIRIELADSKMTMVALDGHRISCVSIPINCEAPFTAELNLPAAELGKILKGLTSEVVEISIGELGISVLDSDSSCKRFTKDMKGEFFKWQQVCQIPHKGEIKLDLEPLKNAVELVAAVVPKDKKMLVLHGKNNKINLQGVEESKVERILEVEKEGEDIKIGLSIAYLLEAINALSRYEHKIKLQYTDAESPIKIFPNSGLDYTYIVLPVRLK